MKRVLLSHFQPQPQKNDIFGSIMTSAAPPPTSGQDAEEAAELMATMKAEHPPMKAWYNNNPEHNVGTNSQLSYLKSKYGESFPAFWQDLVKWDGWKEVRREYLVFTENKSNGVGGGDVGGGEGGGAEGGGGEGGSGNGGDGETGSGSGGSGEGGGGDGGGGECECGEGSDGERGGGERCGEGGGGEGDGEMKVEEEAAAGKRAVEAMAAGREWRWRGCRQRG